MEGPLQYGSYRLTHGGLARAMCPDNRNCCVLSLDMGRCGGGWDGNGKGGMIGRTRLQPVSASWSFSELSIPTFFA